MAALLPLLASCGSLEKNIALAVVTGANSPSSQIEQIYYLGVFDPQEQLPPAVYRVRVRGQASFIGLTRFSSGWVHASVIDSLSGSVGFNQETGGVSIEKDDANLAHLKTGRRLMMFGPEGFREAPKDHRLVVVMGSNPEGFFQAVDQTLGQVSQARAAQRDHNLQQFLFDTLSAINSENARLRDFENDLDLSFATAPN